MYAIRSYYEMADPGAAGDPLLGKQALDLPLERIEAIEELGRGETERRAEPRKPDAVRRSRDGRGLHAVPDQYRQSNRHLYLQRNNFV